MFVVVAVEAGIRAVRGTPPAGWVERLDLVAIIVLLVTSAGGLGLLLAGPGPHEGLHVLYAVLAIGILPVADSLARNASARRRAAVTAVSAVIGLVLIGRLIQTG